MKFPIDVIKINNKIVLMKGQITKQFIQELNETNDKMFDDEVETFKFIDEYGDEEDFAIRTANTANYLLTSAIVIDDRIKQHRYKFNSFDTRLNLDDEDELEFEARLFDIYKNAIDHYKGLMGYE